MLFVTRNSNSKSSKEFSGTMAESTTQSKQHDEEILAHIAETQTISPENEQQGGSLASHRSTIIWTPRFIVIFALTLAVGLSLASLTTQGWDNHYYQPEWILLGNTVILLA